MTTTIPGTGGSGGGGSDGGGGGLGLGGLIPSRRKGGRSTSTQERTSQANVPSGSGSPFTTVQVGNPRRRQRETILTGSTGPGESGTVRVMGITGN